MSVRTQEALAMFERFGVDPLEEQLKLCEDIKRTIHSTKDKVAKADYRKVLIYAYKELMKYKYPQLKAIEHSGDVSVTHRLERLEKLPDAELIEAVRTLREERHAVNGQLPG
jgi:hypothetical protein